MSILLYCLAQWATAHARRGRECCERCRSSGDEDSEDCLPNRILFHSHNFFEPRVVLFLNYGLYGLYGFLSTSLFQNHFRHSAPRVACRLNL